MKDLGKKIADAAAMALVDRTIRAERTLAPLLIDNSRGSVPLCDVLARHLRDCGSFDFSVAFITQGGLEAIIQPLREALDNGAKGRVLTTDYLAFSEPQALERLKRLSPAIETRVFTDSAFHTKGYGFKRGDANTLIVGSSNLTQGALKSNREWNVQLTSTENGAYCDAFSSAFLSLWSEARPLTDSWLDTYSDLYRHQREQLFLRRKADDLILHETIEPNAMQRDAAVSLQNIRLGGQNKALIIAATGTGKTFLSCFDVKQYEPRRMLFLVHREQILKAAAASFIQVLGIGWKDIGFVAGGKYELDRKYVFATVNSMLTLVSRREVEADWFDYVIIDEVHRAGAPGYQRIFSYLKPDFLLGMSATPDRTDGFNIYEMFDYSIACDIRLQEALENELLCPFHYFGITDVHVDGELIDDDTAFERLAGDERVRHIIEMSEFYGYSGKRVKGLIFTKRKEEARLLSAAMNRRGLRTAAVTGETPVAERMRLADRLQQDEEDGNELDYLLSVDVFNEGVDMPAVNQVIMLRPTESSIIFIQQLGRGLRKDEGKDFLVVIDFIANYKKNYLIPVALSGDSSYNKDNLRRDTFDSNRTIPGCSTVSFDPVARQLIYSKIDEASFSSAAFLKEQYSQLKYKLGRIPMIRDFREDNTVDIQRYVDGFGSYYSFLVKYEKDFTTRLTDDEERSLVYISKCFSEGKRRAELRILKEILDAAEARASCNEEAANPDLDFIAPSVLASFTLSFAKDVDRKGRFRGCEMLDFAGHLTRSFAAMLEKDEYRRLLGDIVEDGLARNSERYSNRYKDTDFVLFEKYTYEDVCRLLRWEKNETAQNIGGYKYDAHTDTLPVFINYKKDEEAIGYEDRFVSPTCIIALSKKNRKPGCPDAQKIYGTVPEYRNTKRYLFVRKFKDDNDRKEFYFLGEIRATGEPEVVSVDGTDAFEITYILDHPVREDILNYLSEA